MSTTADPKIIDLINEKKSNGILTSLEYFPPRTEVGIKVCTLRFEKKSHGHP